MRKHLKRLALACLAGLGCFTCNVSEKSGDTLLTVTLSDSLRHYDSILIVVTQSGGEVYKRDTLRQAEYGPSQDGKFSAVIDLGQNPPTTYDILITTYGGTKTTQYRIEVTPGKVSPPIRLDTADTSHPKPTRVVITTAPLTLATHGTTVKLEAHVEPAGADQHLLWSSSNTASVTLDSDGTAHPGEVGEADIVATSKVDTTLSATVHLKVIVPPHVDSLRVTPDSLTLYVGGASAKLLATVYAVGGAATAAVFASSDTSVATVGADGTVVAKGVGTALITARPLGDSILSATCHVTALRDVPSLDVGNDRKVKLGEEVTFPIHVAQQYGGVAALKWDLDGDGVYDDSVADSVAAPKHTYTSGNTQVTVKFYVRDTEGNITVVTRKVLVGSALPLVDIVRPSGRDTVVNKTPFTLEYLVDTLRHSKTVALSEGPNTFVIADTNDAGVGSDTVVVTLDTKAPVVKITSPVLGYLTNKASVAVNWTVDGVAQSGATTESLVGKQGLVTIVREAVDAAGNRGVDSVFIYRDTIPPEAPVVSGTTPTGLPTWNWTAGNGSDGNRKFRYRLSTSSNYSAETSNTFYSPPNLTTGIYTLFVQERDAAENWSSDGSFAIAVDKTGPSLSISSPSDFGRVANFDPQVTGSVTDAHAVSKVEYRLNATDYLNLVVSGGAWNFTAAYNVGANTVWIRGTDEFGNQDSIQVKIYKYPNVIFVRKGATGTGKSWEDAIGELYQVLDTNKSYPSGTQIWVTKGSYSGNQDNDLTIYGRSNLGIFGGFYSDKPSPDFTSRDTSLGATIILPSTNISSFTIASVTNFVLDGFTLQEIAYIDGSNIMLRNLKISEINTIPEIMNIHNTYATFENCDFKNLTAQEVVFFVGSGHLNLNNCVFVGVTTTSNDAPIELFSSSMTIRNSYFKSNLGKSGPYNIAMEDTASVLDIDSSQVQGGKTSILLNPTSPPNQYIFNYGNSNSSL